VLPQGDDTRACTVQSREMVIEVCRRQGKSYPGAHESTDFTGVRERANGDHDCG